MPPPNLPVRPARRPPALFGFDTEADGILSPTMLAQPSLLELEDLLEDLKPKKQAEVLVLDTELVVQTAEKDLGPQRLPVAGDIIGGTYLVEGELGSGAMGVVLLAVDQRLKRKVAVKLIQSSLFAKHF